MKHFYLKHILISISLFIGVSGFANEVVDIDGIRYYIFTDEAKAQVAHSDYAINDDNYIYTPSRYSGDVVIPASITYNGNTYVVTGIGSNAFFQCSNLTSVEIPNTVTAIYTAAFYDCWNMTTISLPNSLTEISNNAFKGCSLACEIISVLPFFSNVLRIVSKA